MDRQSQFCLWSGDFVNLCASYPFGVTLLVPTNIYWRSFLPSISYPHTSQLKDLIAQRFQSHKPQFIALDNLRHAAVLILILPDADGESSVLLTRRPVTLKRHSGQYALPGGRLETGESVTDAALRETHEEVGVSLTADAVMGQLDDYVTRSGFCISCLVAWSEFATGINPDPDEVAAVHHIPLWDLGSSKIPKLLPSENPDKPVMCAPLQTLGHEVYTPTAAILYQFREVALFGRSTRVSHFDQPKFAWK
ncbi:MAG: 8-oxo-dGTP pyrophosphatase MutT (NUDIX family) [Parasphingorhabdus sp.]